jgi:hypothetical protein
MSYYCRNPYDSHYSLLSTIRMGKNYSRVGVEKKVLLATATCTIRKGLRHCLYVSPKMRNLPVLERALPFPVTVPISSNVLFGGPFLKFSHFVQSPNWQSAITGTGHDSFRPISGTGLCHFQYGHSLGPVPGLDSMRMVPFPVPGSASSGTVIHWAPYWNWTLCAWSHFRYRALPRPATHVLGPVPWGLPRWNHGMAVLTQANTGTAR